MTYFNIKNVKNNQTGKSKTWRAGISLSDPNIINFFISCQLANQA